MPELSFRYSVPAPTAEERDLLMLEQEQWDYYTGVLTRSGLLRYLRASLYGTDDDARILCPGDEGLTLTLYAWPLAPDVRFRLAASVGTLGPVIIDAVPAAEAVSFRSADRASLRHPAARVTAVRWLTGPYDAAGRIVSGPAVNVSGREVALSAPVWGTAWIESVGTRYTCTLSIPSGVAEPLLAAGWSEYVIGLPEGGRPVALALNAPPGAEAQAASDSRCGRGSVSLTIRRGEAPPPTAQKKDKRIRCDYCPLTCEEPTYG